MKVAIITSGFLPVVDGVTVTVFQRVRYLSQWGHQVLLFCPDYQSLASVYPDWQDYTGEIFPNVTVVNLASTPLLDLTFERNVSYKSYQTVLDKLAIFQPDIIHVDEPERLWLGFLKLAGVTFARQAKIPCISFFHTNFIEYLEDYLPLPFPFLKILQFVMLYHRNWIYNSYDLTLVSSSTTAQKLVKLGFQKIINANLLGIDLPRFQKESKNSDFFDYKYRISGITHKVKLVFLGRLTPDKGWDFTLKTFKDFADKINFEDLAFIIAGEGFMQEEVRKKLQSFTPHVYLLGKISHLEVPALLINSDIHITASVKETRGLTVLEALAAGIPVIAPCAGGIIDSIQEGENGFLFDPQDAEDFIRKLNLLIKNVALRAAIGAKAKKNLEQYSWEKAVSNLIAIWQDQIVQQDHRVKSSS